MTDSEPDRLTLLEARLARAERRLAVAEDQLALWHVVAGYGPAVDSGSAEATAQMWTEEGVYDTYPVVLHGRDALRGMVTGARHQALIQAGAAHLMGLPHIVVDGDRAVVTNYSQLVLNAPDENGYRIWRTGANRWEFTRTDDGWKVTHRWNRQLDGTDEGRDLLARAVGSEA
ncbi:nuclear transport factor 2 family protein [Micromonospora sp. NPDC023956]|uniref:nuclear transport factor 2 family protein n=1 Tax=Micromonospora sp. NPDC023956 TaxID=3155722 RepID=UPI0033E55FB6